nr:MAG TPA: hypothetical protein [Caudoviricetes sp.]
MVVKNVANRGGSQDIILCQAYKSRKVKRLSRQGVGLR